MAIVLGCFLGHVVPGLAQDEVGRTLPELRQALGSDNGNVRRKAVEALAGFREPEVVDLLLEAYQREEHDSFGVKAASARSLGAQGMEPAVEALSVVLRDSDYWVRRMAVEGLAKIPGESSTRQLMKAAEDPDGRVREAALLALGGRSGGEQTLLDAALDPNPDLAAAALEGLAASDHPRALPLLEGGLDEASWKVRYRAASLLARRGDPRGFEVLSQAVAEGEHVGAALREVSCVGEDAVPLLVELYADPGVSAQGRILDVLEAMPCSASTEFFLDLAARAEADDGDRVRAAMVLYDRREALTREQVQEVAGLLAEQNENLVAVALQVLLERGGSLYLGRIAPLAHHDNKVVRHFSLANLKQYGGAAYEEIFLEALNDDNGANVRMALEALGEVGTVRSLPAIQALVEDRKLRRYALAAAEAIEARSP